MNALIQIDDAVFIQDQQVKTTSLKVAEIFNKQHKDVLRKLESLECSSDFNERNFTLVKYKDAKGENRPMYEMTKVFAELGTLCNVKSPSTPVIAPTCVPFTNTEAPITGCPSSSEITTPVTF